MAEKYDDLCKEIREVYDYFMQRWDEQRKVARQDLMLMANRPFTNDELKRRKKSRPLVLVDGVSQYTNQIINNIRQNPRGVNFSPMNFQTDRKEAERRANVARGIEKASDAQAAYSTAFEGAVAGGGMGFLRLTQEYESVDSDKQVLRIVRVPNHLSILPDPDCQKIDFGDMKRCFVMDTERYSGFTERHPDASMKEFPADLKAKHSDWLGESEMRVAEYWKVKERRDVLLVTASGSFIKGALPEGVSFVGEDGGYLLVNGQPAPLIREIPKIVPSVWQYFTNGVDIIEEPHEWDPMGDSIPIYPIVGRELYTDDGSGPKREYVSAIRFISWAVKGMAYVRSLQVELAQMTPKTPYMAIDGQLEGMDGWATLHTDPRAYVYYRAKLEQFGEVILPPPTRVPFDPPIQALELLHQAFKMDLEAAMGMYRASVGNQSGMTSGKMAQELDKQSDQGSFHFTHNYNQTLERLWTDINNRMDKVYDTARDIGGVKADGTPELIRLNDPSNPDSLHMGKGKFAATVSVGPSMESETEDARNLADMLVKADPALFARIADLVVKLNGKGPVVDEIAKRLTPPGADQDEITPGQMQQAQQMVQELQAQLAEAQKIIEAKQIEAESRERIAKENNQTAIEVAKISAGVKVGDTTTKANADLVKTDAQIAADREAQESEHAHELLMQNKEHAHSEEIHESDQELALVSQGSKQAHEDTQAEKAAKAALHRKGTGA